MPLPVTLFFVVATAVLAWGSARLLWTGLRGSLRTLGWRRTTGTVVRCDLRDGDPLVITSQARRARRLDLAVEYEVDGVQHTTDQVSTFGHPGTLYYAGRSLARLRRRFRPGSQVPVHYNPTTPADAVLLRAELGLLLTGTLFTLVFGAVTPLLLWAGLTIMEPTRAREAKAVQALQRQAPPVLAQLRAHPELGRLQYARGFSAGGPHGTPPTPLTGDWTYGVETTEGYFHVRATQGRVVEVTEWENPSGDPPWLRTLKRRFGL